MTTKTRAELETIIRRAADEKSWDVFSEDPKVIRKLTQNHGEGEHWGGGRRWELPPTAISFRKPVKLSDSQRQKASERLAAAREKQRGRK